MGAMLSIENDVFVLWMTTGESNVLSELLWENKIFANPEWNCPNCQMAWRGFINRFDGTCWGCGDVILHDIENNALIEYMKSQPLFLKEG